MNSGKKIVMVGNHVGGKGIIETLMRAGYRFDHFVSLSPEDAKRNKVSGYYDYSQMAKEHSVPLYYAKSFSLTNPVDIEFFQTHKFDLLIQGGWQRLIPEMVLKTFSIGALGYHGSSDLLPKGRGRSPMNWSLIEKKSRFIMHLFLIKPGVDDGDIIDILEFDINEWDDIQTLYYKYSISNEQLLSKNLPRILNGDIQILPQVGTPSYYEKRTEEDGRIDWETMDIYAIYDLVRATTRPYSGVLATIQRKNCRIWRVRIFDTRLKFEGFGYGDVCKKFEELLVINCLGGLLLVEEYEEIVS